MYARVTTYRVDPAKLGEMVASIDEIKAKMAEISGMLMAYSAWNDDGAGVVTAVYESEAAAEAAKPQIGAVWAGLEGLLTAAPRLKPSATSRKCAE